MHKKELIGNLRKFIETYNNKGESRWKGQYAFTSFLIYYFENLSIPHDEKYDHWRIEPYLPELMVDAFEQLRTGKDKETFRKLYVAETGHEVPNITDLGKSNILYQSSAVQTTLGFMLKEVTGSAEIEHQIDTYCKAQYYVLQQTFDKFLRLVYRRGLYELIDKCNKSGMSGMFGKTELRTFMTAGRILFTFARRIDKNKGSYYKKGDELYCNERSVSFVGEDGDPLCLSAGLQSVFADFRTSLDLIEDVIKRWPADINKQKKLYKADNKVTIG